jgi:hypothetical protein
MTAAGRVLRASPARAQAPTLFAQTSNEPRIDRGTLRPEETYTATELLRAVLREAENDVQKAFAILREPRLRDHSCARSAARILARTARKRGVTHVDYAGRGFFEARPVQMSVVGVDQTYATVFERPLEDTMSETQMRVEYEAQIRAYPQLKLIRLLNSQKRTIAIYPSIQGGPCNVFDSPEETHLTNGSRR